MKEEWKKVKLGEVLDSIIGGGTPSKSVKNYWNGNLYWCSVKDMSDDIHYLEKTEDTITEEGLKNSTANLIKKGTVITATRMGLGRAFINKVDMTINQDLKALIPNSKIDNIYLLWTIIANRSVIANQGRGATVPGITLDMLKDLDINLPPLPTQQKIASILSAYDDLIENNRRQIKLLEEAALKLYKEWFVKLNFPGHENTKIADGVPDGWKKVKAGDYFDITIGKTPPRKESKWFSACKGKKWISIADMGNSGTYILNTSEYLTEEAVKSHNVKVIPANTVLLSFKLTVGRVSITSEEMTTNEAIAHFVTDKDFVIEYLYLNLKNYNYNSLGSTSAISTAINSKIVKSMPIIIPDEKILKMFSNLMKPYFNKIKNCQLSIVNLQLARDKLLPKLMNGEIEV